MSYRTMSVTQFTAWKRNQRNKAFLDLSKLPDGADFLDVFDSLYGKLNGNPVRNQMTMRYADIKSWERNQRSISATVAVGTFGDRGSVRDIQTGVEEFAVTPDHAAALDLRCLTLVPPGAQTALLFIEHGQNQSAATELLRSFKDLWRKRYPKFTLGVEAVVRASEWIESADLEAVTVVSYGHESDLADSGVPKVLGEMRAEIRPPSGQKFFPHSLKDKLMGHSIDRAKLLGFSKDQTDQIKVKLAYGGQARTFVIDEERTPGLRYVLSESNQPTPTDGEFRRKALDSAVEVFAAVGGSWQATWEA